MIDGVFQSTLAHESSPGWVSPNFVFRRVAHFMSNMAGFECECLNASDRFSPELQGQYKANDTDSFQPARTEFVFDPDHANIFEITVFPELKLRFPGSVTLIDIKEASSIELKHVSGVLINCTNYLSLTTRKVINSRYV